MRILQLIQRPQLRGAEVFACQLSEHLNAAGHHAVIAALFPGTQLPPFQGKCIYLNRPYSKRHVDYKGWKQLAEWIQQENPEIIQANAADTLKYAVCSKLFFGWKQPLVFRNASTVSLYIRSSLVKKYNSFLYKHVDRIISVSEHSRNDFVTMFPFCKDKIETIPIGIEDIAFQKLPAFNNGMINLIHVGGFSFEKNHEGLIRIFKKMLAQRNDICLWLVGDGPLRHKTETIVEQNGLSDKVIFTGFVNNPVDYIFSSDVLLLPSIIEGLPGVVLEANYCKTPVVAYRVGGVSEVVNDKTGWLVEKEDEEGFVSAVVEAISMNEKREELIIHAYNNVVANFMNRIIAQRFLTAYAALVHAY